MNDVYLSIGTNIGDRKRNLQEAVKMLVQTDGVAVKKISSIYETAPVGYVDQDSFLNICVYLQTDKNAEDMLLCCQEIENELGRVRLIRWGPRIIDLDILLYNEVNMETEHLTIPHPRMYERAFVLIPLMEVVQTMTPQLEKAKEEYLAIDREKEGVQIWMESLLVEEFVRFES